MPAESSIALRPVSGSDNWTGAITIGNNPGLIDIVAGDSSRYVLRSTIDWFNLEVWEPLGDPGRLVFERSDIAAPTVQDLRILDAVRERLATAPEWNRADERNCSNDPPTATSLYCALVEAATAEMGRYYHRQPALQRVRRVIREKWADRITSHRLMDFNNHPETTMDQMLAALEQARELTEQDID